MFMKDLMSGLQKLKTNNLLQVEVPAKLSKEFLASRGSCCGSKCSNCPYTPKWVKGSKD
jgi:hypothetical protein